MILCRRLSPPYIAWLGSGRDLGEFIICAYDTLGQQDEKLIIISEWWINVFHLTLWKCPKTVQPPRDESSRWTMCQGILNLQLSIAVVPCLGDTCVLAVFLQDKCLRVEIVFQDDVVGLYVNRSILFIHRIGLEPWIGPKENSSRSRHDPRTWNCRLACMIVIKKTRHTGKKNLPYRICSEILSSAVFCYNETFLYRVMSLR